MGIEFSTKSSDKPDAVQMLWSQMMPKKKSTIDEKELTKGELRKLKALRKSIGDNLGNEAFAKWYAEHANGEETSDPNISLIADALNTLIKQIRIPRGGAYAIRRGRGRFIVEAVDLKH